MSIQLSSAQQYQNMMDLAVQAESTLKTNLKTTRSTYRELYARANQKVLSECTYPDPVPEEHSLLPVIAETYATVSNDAFKDDVPLHRNLSRVFRILIELRWNHALKNKERMPIATQLRDQFITITQSNVEILGDRAEAMPAVFEYRCARQAARMLNPVEPLYKKYIVGIVKIFGCLGVSFPGGVNLSLGDLAARLRYLHREFKKDDPKALYSWYPTVQTLRWYSLRVESIADFQTIIESNQKLCKKKGRNYSNCLATVLIEIFKRSTSLRQNAFDRLVELYKWAPEKPSSWEKFKKKVFGCFIKKYLMGHYTESNKIARLFLKKLSNSKKYGDFYQNASKELLDQTALSPATKQKEKSINQQLTQLLERDEQLSLKRTHVVVNIVTLKKARAGAVPDSLINEKQTLEKELKNIAEQGSQLLEDLFSI